MICDLCKNKEFSSKIGVICGLTQKKPNVEQSCDFYDEDDVQKRRYARAKKHRKEADSRVDKRNLDLLDDLIWGD